MIIYFSGTGNSRYAAEYIANITEDERIDAAMLIKEGRTSEQFTSDRPFVFVSPTYGWRIPRVFEAFIRSSIFQGNKSAYFVLTCGSDIGNAGRRLFGLCKDVGFEYKGAAEVVMPENYVAMFPVPEPEESERILSAADNEIARIAAKIKKGELLSQRSVTASDRLKSGIVNSIFYAFLVKAKGFYATDQCIGCGKCEQLCPLNNVQLKNGRPSWGKSCTHCMACICGCPVEAIEYKKISQGKVRYFNEKKAPKA